jgi:hypothetical protein
MEEIKSIAGGRPPERLTLATSEAVVSSASAFAGATLGRKLTCRN